MNYDTSKIRDGLSKLGNALEHAVEGSKTLPTMPTNSISGNAVHGGKVTLFRSTGITDQASKLVLLVRDDGITVDAVHTDSIVGNPVVTGDLTVTGTLHVNEFSVDTLSSTTRYSTGLELDVIGNDPVGITWRNGDDKSKVFTWWKDRFYSSDTIEVHRNAGFRIDNVDVLTANTLGPTIQKSSLTEVGVLNNLRTIGDLNIDEFIIWDSGLMRFAIGSELPNAQFSVSSNEAEFIIDPDFDVVKVGTYTTSPLEIITDNKTRISITDRGTVSFKTPVGIGTDYPGADVQLEVAGAVRIKTTKVNVSDRKPIQGTHNQGDVVYNTKPQVGSFAGWICVEAGTPGTWKPFGRIEDE